MRQPIAPFGRDSHLHFIVTHWRELAGIRFRTPQRHGLHSLRHTLATQLLREETPLHVISAILGHTTTASTLIYAKADVEALLSLAGFGVRLRCQPAQHPALHPGQTAELYVGGNKIGMLGVLHPEPQSKLGLDRPVILFELKIAAILTANAPIFHEISKFPAIRRDLALVVAETIPAQQVLDCVSNVAGKLLINLELFDEYRGKGIDSGRKSLALGLTLQDSSRTLNEAEVEKVMAKVVATLQSELGAVPRQ